MNDEPCAWPEFTSILPAFQNHLEYVVGFRRDLPGYYSGIDAMIYKMAMRKVFFKTILKRIYLYDKKHLLS